MSHVGEITHHSPLQLPQLLHRLRIVAGDLPHVIVLQSHHGFQHETHLGARAHIHFRESKYTMPWQSPGHCCAINDTRQMKGS